MSAKTAECIARAKQESRELAFNLCLAGGLLFAAGLIPR